MKNSIGERGLSLLEISIVMLAIVIIGLVSVPNLVSYLETHSLDVLVVQVSEDIRLTQGLAKKNQSPYKIVFNPGTTQYQIYSSNSETDTWVLFRESPSLAKGVQFNESDLHDHQLIFNKFGVPYEDEQTDAPSSSLDLPLDTIKKIGLQSEDNLREIFIHPSTGLVTKELSP